MPEHDPTTSVVTCLSSIVEQSFSAELLHRQRTFTEFRPEYAPVAEHVEVTLAVIKDNEGQPHQTLIGNVRAIGARSCIGGGVTIGDHATLLTRVTVHERTEIESFASLEHNVQVGSDCRIENGAVLTVGSCIGDGVIVGQGAEVGYDVSIEDNYKIPANEIASVGSRYD